MNKFIDSIHTLHNNPFILTPLIVEAYKYLNLKPKNILLSYLILPLVLNERSRENLQKANILSSLHTFTDSKDKKKRNNIFGLPERIENYKELTNLCIQHAVDNEWIKINEDLSVEVLQEVTNKSKNLTNSFKASSNIYKVFKDLDVVTIYRLLGVKEL